MVDKHPINVCCRCHKPLPIEILGDIVAPTGLYHKECDEELGRSLMALAEQNKARHEEVTAKLEAETKALPPLCNLCGETCCLGQWKEPYGLVNAIVKGAYSSTVAMQDLTSYTFSLCEYCLDWLFQEFKLPVLVRDYVDGLSEEWIPGVERKNREGYEKYLAEYQRRASLRREPSLDKSKSWHVRIRELTEARSFELVFFRKGPRSGLLGVRTPETYRILEATAPKDLTERDEIDNALYEDLARQLRAP